MAPATSSEKKRTQKQNIIVAVRVRGLNEQEKASNLQNIVKVNSPTELQVKSKKYMFDKVFEPEETQMDVYLHTVAPMVKDVLSGYNCTLFAYGQTGSGKTFTIVGGNTDTAVNWRDDSLSGCIPRAAANIFDEINARGNTLCATVRVSFLEIYNEEIYDLLSDDYKPNSLSIYSDVKGQVTVQGLTEISVNHPESLFHLIHLGTCRRTTAPTLMNHQSSRSHTIFTININIRETSDNGEEILKIGKINLVDLAGSENSSKSGCKDLRAVESSNINKSLLTLGRVIQILTQKGSKSHIPYRDSKLTRLLSDSLGGNTKTSIIATVSPVHTSYEETINTLDYASRARDIKNTPTANEKVSKDQMIQDMSKELEKLKKDLEAARAGDGFFVNKENWEEMNKTAVSASEKITERDKLIEEKTKKLSELEEHMKVKIRAFDDVMRECRDKERSLDVAKIKLKEQKLRMEQEKYLSKFYENRAVECTDHYKELYNNHQQLYNDNAFLRNKLEQLRSVSNNIEELVSETLPVALNHKNEVLKEEEINYSITNMKISQSRDIVEEMQLNVENCIDDFKEKQEGKKVDQEKLSFALYSNGISSLKQECMEECDDNIEKLEDAKRKVQDKVTGITDKHTQVVDALFEANNNMYPIIAERASLTNSLTKTEDTLIEEIKLHQMDLEDLEDLVRYEKERMEEKKKQLTWFQEFKKNLLNMKVTVPLQDAVDNLSNRIIDEENVYTQQNRSQEELCINTVDSTVSTAEQISRQFDDIITQAREFDRQYCEPLDELQEALREGFDSLRQEIKEWESDSDQHYTFVKNQMETADSFLNRVSDERIEPARPSGDTPKPPRLSFVSKRKPLEPPAREKIIRSFQERLEAGDVSVSEIDFTAIDEENDQ